MSRDRIYFLRPTRGGGWTVVTVVEHGRYHDSRPSTWLGPFASPLDAVNATPPLKPKTHTPGACDRCARNAERATSVIELAERANLVDDNDISTQILDLVINFRHLLDTLAGDKDQCYESWEHLIDSVESHYNAEVAGEDCDKTCEKHAHLFTDEVAGS